MIVDEDVLFEEQRTLAQAIEADPEAGVKRDELVTETLGVALENLGTLIDLRHTIQSEGVSSHDITALKQIHSSMESFGLAVPVSPSLEAYSSLFTPTRSSLNLKVSNEAIGAAILATIKEMFRMLVDFVAKTIRWIKSLTMSEDLIRGRMIEITKSLSQLESNWRSMEAMNKLSTRSLTDKYYAAAEVCLADPKLPRSKLGLLAFGSKEDIRKITTVLSEAQKYGGLLLDQIRLVRQVLEGTKPEWDFDSHIGPRLTTIAKDMQDLDSESDDPNYFINNKNVGIAFYENTRDIVKREVYGYRFIYDIYGKCADELRKVTRFNFDESKVPVAVIQGAVASINEGIKALNDLVEVFHKIPLYQYKVTATYCNFFIQANDIVKADFYANIVTDVSNAGFKALDKKFDEIKRGLGI